MSLIQIENLTFSYPSSSDTIFENVSFQIDTNWKLGFVGRNGRGKTTFLNLLLGNYAYQGTIRASVQFDYFPYPVCHPERNTQQILLDICPQAQSWELVRELSCLHVSKEVLDRPFSTLSNGEQTKVLLAALFLNPGHFLLIDEPTNHLDAAARELVRAYLKRKKGFLLVSHDRQFLDGCVDHILSINRANIAVQSGNFSSWLENFQRQQHFELAQNAKLERSIDALQKAAKQTGRWSDKTEASKFGNGPVDRGYIGHKAVKMMKRAKAIETRKQQAISEKSSLLKNQEQIEELKLFPLRHHADTLLTISQLAPMYDGRAVCKPVTFSVKQGERIVLDGGNGSGKSSLLKLLTGQALAHQGSFSLGSGVRLSYVPQDTACLQGPLDAYAEYWQIEESLFKTVLHQLGFSAVQFQKDMEDLSAGQKKKVLLAKSLCQQAHLYIWDEPLNYIDFYSRIQIEQLILEYEPTMLFVEHDLSFREKIATRTIHL